MRAGDGVGGPGTAASARTLYLYCHPVPESFHGAIRERARESLGRAGTAVDLLDLYAEDFDPILGPEERRSYHDTARNRAALAAYIRRLEAAEALVVQFPTWCFGPPAMLKGFFDRLFMPGVAFDLSDPAKVRPLLSRIRRITGIVTYGRPRPAAIWMGDPPRKLVTRYLPWFAARDVEVRYLAIYHMNTASPARRARFLDRVGAAMARPRARS